jgi:plastocyanin
MRRLARLGIGALVGALVLAAAGCGGDDGGGGSAAPATTAAAATTTTAASGGGGTGEDIQLTAQGFKWSNTDLQVTAGSSVTVEVRNQDSAEHNFTFQEAGADQDVQAGEDAKVTFTAPAAGAYQFVCKYHPSQMKGTVTVA